MQIEETISSAVYTLGFRLFIIIIFISGKLYPSSSIS